MTLAIFIQYLGDKPQFFFAVVITVVISITLHELAHGRMAIHLGDRTPLESGHMTGNPLVHMGPMSIIALMLMGIAWGAMPINPGRLRGKYAEALVAFAGPLTNLLLSAVGIVGIGLWLRFGHVADPAVVPDANNALWNLYYFGTIFAWFNMALFLFNMLPISPLDGSHILSNFHRGYGQFIGDPKNQGLMMFAFMLLFVVGGTLIFGTSSAIVFNAIGLVSGRGFTFGM